MIFDDHEVTDDWFLRGSWSRDVLNSDLGRRVLRNALLSYALFQGWGNDPDQFEGPIGAKLLSAVDAWRGDETDVNAATIETCLGLPPKEPGVGSFSGHGDLPVVSGSLTWSYGYAGERFQVIVLNSRTRRTFATDKSFPGLLSD